MSGTRQDTVVRRDGKVFEGLEYLGRVEKGSGHWWAFAPDGVLALAAGGSPKTRRAAIERLRWARDRRRTYDMASRLEVLVQRLPTTTLTARAEGMLDVLVTSGRILGGEAREWAYRAASWAELVPRPRRVDRFGGSYEHPA